VKKGRPGVNAVGSAIEAGDAGIWVTCDLNKEAKCTAELIDLFDEVKPPYRVVFEQLANFTSDGINALFSMSSMRLSCMAPQRGRTGQARLRLPPPPPTTPTQKPTSNPR
jgi:hypothetical protein